MELILADGDSQIVMTLCRAERCTRPVILEAQGYAIEQNWSLPLDNTHRMKAVQELARFLVVLARS